MAMTFVRYRSNQDYAYIPGGVIFFRDALMTQETLALESQHLFTDAEWLSLMVELDLPPRQRETLVGLFNGYSDKQIAAALDIAVPTVRSYLQRMYSKFGVNDRTELVLYVFRVFRELE